MVETGSAPIHGSGDRHRTVSIGVSGPKSRVGASGTKESLEEGGGKEHTFK